MIDKESVWGLGYSDHLWVGRQLGSGVVRILRLGGIVFGGEGRLCHARDPSPLPRWFILENTESSFMEASTLYFLTDGGMVQRTLVGELHVLSGDVNTYTVACKRSTWCVERRRVESGEVEAQWETSAQGILWRALGGPDWFVLDCDMKLRRERGLVVYASGKYEVRKVAGLGDTVCLDHVLVSRGPGGTIDHLHVMMTAEKAAEWVRVRMPQATIEIVPSALLTRAKA